MAVMDQLHIFLWPHKTPLQIDNLNFQSLEVVSCYRNAQLQNTEVRNYSNFTITFPTIWRCAGYFFKVLLKFKMATTNQLYNFCGRKKLQVRNYSNFAITFPLIWCMYVISRFYWNSKRSPWTNFIIFCGREKTWKFRWKIIQILQSHNPPYGNVHVISLKFKIATTSRFFKYLSPQIMDDFRPLVLYTDLK